MSNFIPMVYAVLKDKGIDTKGMTTDEAVEKYNELTGKSGTYNTDNGEEKEDSLIPYTNQEKSNYKSSKRISIAESSEEISKFIEDAIKNKNSSTKLLLGKIPSKAAEKIKADIDIDLSGYNLELRADDISHIINRHGKDKENYQGQIRVEANDIAKFSDIIINYDSVKKGNEINSLIFIKKYEGENVAITYFASGNKSLSLKTLYIRKK